MRTTVTLDPDVIRLLKNESHKRGESFKVALNDAVRKAFQAPPATTGKRKPYVVKAYDMGLMPGIDYSQANKLMEDMDIDAHLALTARLKRELK